MRTTVKLALGVAMLASTTIGVPRAWAAEPSPPIESEEMAKASDEEGLVAAKQGRSAEALDAFTASYRLKPTPARLWRLAITELETSHPVAALSHFRAYVNDPNADGKHMAEAPSLIQEAYHLSSHIRLHAPDGARLYLDGSNNGVLSERELDVMPGHHVARVGDADPVPVMVVAGQLVDVDLTQAGASTPSTKGAAVGDEAAKAGPEGGAAPSERDPEPRRRLSPHRVAALVVGGGAVLGLAGGVTFALLSQKATSDGNAERAAYGAGFCVVPTSQACQTVSNKIDQSRAFDTAAWISYGVGGVLAATAIGLALWPEPNHEQPKSAWMLPLFGPGMAGLGAGGSF